jgi:uncharacterized small protein (DUF1192 family)
MQVNDLLVRSSSPEFSEPKATTVSLDELEKMLANIEHEIERVEASMTAFRHARRREGFDS